MAKFTFDVGKKTAVGNSEKFGNATYRATGKCPYCSSSFKIGFNPGDLKTKGTAESDLRSAIRRHYRSHHEGK